MSTLQERPRVAAATAAAIALVVVVAMLMGGAFMAGRDTPAAAPVISNGAAAPTGGLQRDLTLELAEARAGQHVLELQRDLTLARGHVTEQQRRADAIDQRAQRWRKRALRAERQLKTARRTRARRR